MLGKKCDSRPQAGASIGRVGREPGRDAPVVAVAIPVATVAALRLQGVQALRKSDRYSAQAERAKIRMRYLSRRYARLIHVVRQRSSRIPVHELSSFASGASFALAVPRNGDLYIQPGCGRRS